MWSPSFFAVLTVLGDVFWKANKAIWKSLICKKLGSSGFFPEDFLILVSDIQKPDFPVGPAHNPKLGIPTWEFSTCAHPYLEKAKGEVDFIGNEEWIKEDFCILYIMQIMSNNT